MNTQWKARRDRLRHELIFANMDAILVSYAANRYYLSGFELHDVQYNESAGYLIVAADGRDFLVTDPRFEESAQRVFPADSVVLYKQKAVESLAKLLRSSGKRVAVEQKSLSYATLGALMQAAPDLAFGRGDSMVAKLRSIKDAAEIEALERSFAVNNAMFAWLETALADGISEEELAWKVECYFREHGASELAFPSIVAINRNAAMPHALPGKDRLRENALVLVDAGCRVADYCSDQTRTFWFGDTPSSVFTKTHDLVCTAQKKAIEAMKPGVLLKDVDALVRAYFAKAGVESAFTHSLGHGVGLETHEAPSLSSHGLGALEEGMVVTVEPGLYYPAWGGVRNEYTVLIEKNGARIL